MSDTEGRVRSAAGECGPCTRSDHTACEGDCTCCVTRTGRVSSPEYEGFCACYGPDRMPDCGVSAHHAEARALRGEGRTLSVVEGEQTAPSRGITYMDDDTIPAPRGALWLFAGPGKTLAHLTTDEAFDLTSLCGRWFRHGSTKGERYACERPCRACARAT